MTKAFVILLLMPLLVTAQSSGLFTRTLKLSQQNLHLIFQQKEGSRFDLPLENEHGAVLHFQANTFRHLNPGPESGAIRLDLTLENRSFKCLITRKSINGKVEYQLRLMENKGKLNYTLSSLSQGTYLLKETELEDIISQ